MINRVVLIGRLTRDPELRKTAQNNTSVVSFTVAVDDRFKNANGEKSTSLFHVLHGEMLQTLFLNSLIKVH